MGSGRDSDSSFGKKVTACLNQAEDNKTRTPADNQTKTPADDKDTSVRVVL